MSALRISAVTVTPVAFADPPLLNSVGVHEPFALRAVVEVSTDQGLAGLGETYADERHLAALRAAADAIVGADAYHTDQIYRRGQWCKDFGTLKLVGGGAIPKTFLTKDQACTGKLL